LNHRNQWSSVTVPYSTFSGSFDLQALKRRFKQDIIGFGIVLNNDIAGDGNFGTTQGNFSVSYIKALNKRNNHIISFGLQIGAAQQKIDFSKLYFNNQYDGDIFNPNLSNGEHFQKNSLFYPDINFGTHWFFQKDDQLIFNFGAALFHLNKPVVSFFENNDVKLNRRFAAYSGVLIGLDKNIELTPSILFMQQGKYNEMLYGAELNFILNNSPYFYSAFSFGSFVRNNDAIIAKASLSHRKFIFGISYDFNISELHPASRYLGGYEFSIIYVVRNTYQKKAKEVPCPIF
jgi:type IX secretion system PorP/SprF family membrane protein